MLLLKTLGGLQLVTSEAAPAGPATQRRRLALLALVAGHGNRGVTRDKLLGYLWPDGDPERARAALAQALYAIRKDVGGEFLVAGPAGAAAGPT